MALVLADRVKETTTTAGTGTVTLLGASAGFQSFAAVGDTNTTYYTIAAQTGTEWEVGIGTYTSSGTTLSRTTVLSSSNSGSLVNFSAGTKDVFVTYPSSRSVYANGTTLTATNSSVLPVASGGTGATDAATARTNLVVAGTAVSNTFSANQIVEVTDNTNAALRITQLGTGNALLVEDSTNPDSTPFVVAADGTVIRGYTSNIFSTGIQSVSTSAGASSIAIGSFSASGLGAPLRLYHSRSGVIPTNTILQSADELGKVEFYGADGTDYIQGASITAAVDGTPGTSDMPGRLAFNTTADGASTPTERMRIDSAGNVGIGAATTAGQSLKVSKSLTGSTTPIGVLNNGAIQSDATVGSIMYRTGPSVAAAAFTLPSLIHYQAFQGTIGAGATLTSQFGFTADASLTGATNNYGFYSNIASGTGRWNFYAAGTAQNFFAGDVITNGKIGLGTAASPSYGTAGQVLTSAGSGASPTWTTSTAASKSYVQAMSILNGL